MIDHQYYYVDKTNFIKDVCNEKVALYTRPRRFRKTLNMSRRCPPMARWLSVWKL
ncbi:AAA family ATPase [[Clostridium] innocuum]|nr:AAA family ATPase [[Clostridium] innocuum]MCR0578081.1 AAA family ATPase [[Clostridium] innocuum]